MTLTLRYLLLSVLTFATSAAANGSDWFDGMTLSYGHDGNDNETNLFSAGLQDRWLRTWFNGGAWFVGGYWDTELTYMDSAISDAENNELFGLSLTPVFRMQRDASLSSGVSPFAEAGIGAHLLSETRLGNQSYSTALQLGSVVGLGLGFGDNGQYELSYRYQHLTNLGLKQPNDGMDLHMLRLGYSFE